MPERLSEYDPQKRAAQIRRRMLSIARLQASQYASGFVPATNFLSAADDTGRSVANEEEAIEHLGFLVSHELLGEWQPIAMGAARPSFRERRFAITIKGRRLWEEAIDPIPGIDDARFGD
mgnify:CR=1 FL=1